MNEFQFIDRLKSRHALDRVGDDCAVLPLNAESDQLLTADLLVEDIDFRLDWTRPEFLGHKALAVSLSDVAAMGGTARWSMLSFGVPEDLWNSGFLDGFFEGWFDLAHEYGIELVGGDTSRVPRHLVIDSIVGGEVPKGKAILRSTARPGDAVFVSGTLGGAAGALTLLENGARYSRDLPEDLASMLLKQLQPQPELTLANTLQQLDIATSAIDLSDGLSSDLGHICHESQVGAIVYAEQVPVDPLLATHFPADECLDMALNGGEDFRLLFTVAPQNTHHLDDLNVTRIGEITAEPGRLILMQGDKAINMDPDGFRHF